MKLEKAVLSNRLYIGGDSTLYSEIKKKLTYSIPQSKPNAPNIEICDVYRIRDVISVPIGRTDLIPFGYEIVDKRVAPSVELPVLNVVLRPSQQSIYDDVTDNCLINAKVGFGKTITALSLMSKFKTKTLVLVHTTFLLDQWVSEVKKLFGIDAGILGKGINNIDSPIVIAMVQTAIKHVDTLKNEFGLVVLDECLDYGNMVLTKDLGRIKIGVLVNLKGEHEVLSFNEALGVFEWKRILRYFKNVETEPMLRLKFSDNSSLTCTKNHTIYTIDGKREAKDISIGDYIFSEIRHKSSHILREEAKPILLGMILGDGCLQNNGKSNRVSITHGQAQLEYLEYKKSIFNTAFISITKTSSSGYKKENTIHQITTLSFYDMDYWRSDMYIDGHKKCITKVISDTLTIDSWAIMYQDDGTLSIRSVVFSFCELDYSSIEYLQNSLYKLFGIRGKHYICQKGFSYLRLCVEETMIFLQHIAHRVHPCLRYKLIEDIQYPDFEPIKPMELFENFTYLKVEKITESMPTNNFRYNIEVEDNHNYIANGKLVANCHHLPSKTFTDILNKMKARYKIGLSGTLTRKDGKGILIPDYFSRHIIQPRQENVMIPEVHSIFLDEELPIAKDWVNRISLLIENEAYIDVVANICSIYASKGHKVLFVSDRVSFLKELYEILPNSVLITGSTKDREEQLKLITEGDSFNIILGSVGIFKEGISINMLSCLILGIQTNNIPMLEQLVGRICRLYPNKQTPVIVDIVLQGYTPQAHYMARRGHYYNSGYSITNF